MEFTLFSNLISALRQVFDGVQKVTTFTKEQRDQYYQVMGETYQLVDATLNMVIIRLGDIQLMDDEAKFKEEVAKLSNYDEWYRVERDFRLCHNLRRMVRETETLKQDLEGKVSTKDWDNLLGLMYATLATEGESADFITDQFRKIAGSLDGKPLSETRNYLIAFRKVLMEERKDLMRQEVELYNLI